MATEVQVVDVWKRFKWFEDRPRNLKETIINRFGSQRAGQDFWALQGVSLSVSQGETLGLIGNNGAGKSTTLRIIAGLMQPTRGTIVCYGKVSTMIELGLGFHPDFTGRENVYTGGIISGLTRRETDKIFPKIVEFAELEHHIDRPVRTYSTGMYMRLAFSLAIHINASMLLIDEVLTVGDQNFQRKCIDRLYELKDEGKTIVLVSHDLNMVRNFCDRVCWLQNGRVRLQGVANEVVDAYASTAQRESTGQHLGTRNVSVRGGAARLVMGVNRWGSLDVEIQDVTLRDKKGTRRTVFEAGQKIEIEIQYLCPSAPRRAIFQIAICREDGVRCLDANTWTDAVPMHELELSGVVALSIDRLDLGPGTYTIDVGAYSVDWAQTFDYQWGAYSFEVFSKSRHKWVIHNQAERQ